MSVNRSCCGGSEAAQNILIAKGFWLEGDYNMAASAKEGDEDVRISFVGLQSGNIRYVGKISQRVYIFGQNADARTGLVDARDVEHFLNLRDPNTKKSVFEVDEPDDKRAAKALKEKQDAAPAGMEYVEETDSYAPSGFRFVNNRWTPISEIEANGTPEVDADGNPIVDPAFGRLAAAGAVNPDGQPGVTDPAAKAADQTASDQTKTPDALKKSNGGKASDLPDAKK